MDNDPNQPQSSFYGQQPPPLSQQPPSQDGQPQQPPLYESQPPDGQPQYGGSPIPNYWPPQQPEQDKQAIARLRGSPIPNYWPPQPPKKRSSRWLWITLATLGGLIALGCIGSAIFVALSIGMRPISTNVANLNDDGQGSLRQIIANARPGSTITFDKSLRGTILLTSGDLNIAKDLTIRGPGAGILSISSGESGYRVSVRGGVSVALSGLTFEKSKTADGIIYNQGALTLSNSTVSGNTGTGTDGPGGIYNQGALTLSNSTVSGNTGTGTDGPGGIFNLGTLTLSNSTVSGNTSSARGGGIANEGVLTITNSTVSGNMASGEGGGIVTFTDSTLTITNSTISGNTVSGQGSDGGGIANGPNSRITLTNSTISDNTSSGKGGGISNFGSQVDIEFCTIYGNEASDNGGGLSIEDGQDINGKTVPSKVSIRNSIIAGNKAHTDPDITGSLASFGYNLIGDRSGATFSVQQSTDVLGVPSTALRIDPLLRDNGGSAQPHTWTHALLPGSPAIDLIPPEACMMFKVFNDQRGVKRPQGKGCDSGAYEYMPSQ